MKEIAFSAFRPQRMLVPAAKPPKQIERLDDPGPNVCLPSGQKESNMSFTGTFGLPVNLSKTREIRIMSLGCMCICLYNIYNPN
jgi:hypothetical protein